MVIKVMRDKENKLYKSELSLKEEIDRTLERKEDTYKKICEWFENEYDNTTDKDEVSEWEKESIEIKAQIKLLRHLISE
jgi:hypothetical protein